MLHEDRNIIMDASNMCVHSALCLLMCVCFRENKSSLHLSVNHSIQLTHLHNMPNWELPSVCSGQVFEQK